MSPEFSEINDIILLYLKFFSFIFSSRLNKYNLESSNLILESIFGSKEINNSSLNPIKSSPSLL